MWSTKLLLRTSRIRRLQGRRHLLSQSFSLEKDWASRHVEMAKLGLGGDYEWISAVQKKFVGGGVASAIDVDVAVYIAEQKDQVDDVIELIYKLRHSENAADLLPSTEYALIRLLLRYNPSFLFKLADDPVRFLLIISSNGRILEVTLPSTNIKGAARLSAWIMQQEMTENELLNLLVLYSCAKWAELPAEQQTMPCEESEEVQVNEDDIKTFKFPYLKNPHFDSHFDLTDPHLLAGKTLLWVARDSKSLPDQLQQSLMLLGAVLYDRFAFFVQFGKRRIYRYRAIHFTWIYVQLERNLIQIRGKEEEALASEQKVEFTRWHQRRHDLIKAQADRLLLKIRAREIANELAELDHHEEKLNFFENRLKWEKKAKQNTELMEELAEKAQK
ncbi:unnamed protein product [Angiostrongylus costaricensis]|uniref:Uncharacterized protein n=1 Tax=Angiostrongylus costaricensis TaxID=334426 RepID=A0A0R3PQS7_ANGCS|nr:unnamed protein product [Angiostrongylus costaricensis]